MNQPTKAELLAAAQNCDAEFVKEEAGAKDSYTLYFRYNGILFTVSAYGPDRWLMDDETFVDIVEE